MTPTRRPAMVRTTATTLIVMMVLTTNALLAAVEPASTDTNSELAHAIAGAWLPLESGLAVSAGEGTPLSAKYEIDDGAFQLSVYTWKSDTVSGDSFAEVIVDFSTGLVARVSGITHGGDLAAAQSQQAAMAQA